MEKKRLWKWGALPGFLLTLWPAIKPVCKFLYDAIGHVQNVQFIYQTGKSFPAWTKGWTVNLPPHFDLIVFVLGILWLTILVFWPSQERGERAGKVTATGMVRRLDPTSDGPHVQLDYEWHDDTTVRNADRKDRPLELVNSSDSDAVNVQINPVHNYKWTATFEPVSALRKGQPAVAVTPKIEYDGHFFEIIKNNFATIFLRTNTPGLVVQIPIAISYSDIQGQDYGTHYILTYDPAQKKAGVRFEGWGRFVEVKPPSFLSSCQRFVLKILGRKQS